MKKLTKKSISFIASIAFAVSLSFGIAAVTNSTEASATTEALDTSLKVQMREGASVRIGTDTTNGDQAIRFQAYIKKSYFDTMVNPETGVYIIPKDLLKGELTNETPRAKRIPSQVLAGETETHYIYNTVLYEIPENSYGRDIVARAYVKNGSNYVWAENAQVRSLSYVASQELNEVQYMSGDGYKYTATQLNYLTNYVDKALSAFNVDETTYTVMVGDTETVATTITPVYAEDDLSDLAVYYTSNNESVATVEDGEIVAKAAGIAKITAMLGTRTDTFTVQVKTENQDLIMSNNKWALDFSVPANYTITSITCNGENWGTDPANLSISDTLKNTPESHGQKVVTINVSDGESSYAVEIPVTLVTATISSASDFSKVQVKSTTESIFGYYILTDNITSASAIATPQRIQATDDGSKGFRGTFDGRGYSVTNPASTGGIFGGIGKGAVIKNTTFTCTSIAINGYMGYLATDAIGATIQDCTFNFSGITGSENGTKGLVFEQGARGCSFINLTINIDGKANNLFGHHVSNWLGFNANQQNYWNTISTFENCVITLANTDSSLAMLGEGYLADGAGAGTGTVTQFIVDGCTTAPSDTTKTVEGIRFVSYKKINIALDHQELYMSDSTQSIDLGVYAGEGYKLQSITMDGNDLGKDLANLIIPDSIKNDKTKHGEGKVITVIVTTAEEIITLNIPVTLITQEISTLEDFLTLQPATTTTAVHGYYVLANDIKTTTAIGAPADGATNNNGLYGFRGTLDGRGHTFTFKIAQQGLFGTVGNGARFKDITLEAVESTNAYKTAVFGRMVMGATFDNMTFKFTNPKASNATNQGMIAEFTLRDCKFTNVDFITNKNIDCLFSGTQQANWGFNGAGKLCSFTNCTVYLMEGATIKRLGATAYNGGIVYIADGCTETAGTKVEDITIKAIGNREETLGYSQDLYLTAKLQMLDLGEYADYQVASIKLGNYDFGTNPARLTISDAFKADKASHGDQNLVVVVQKGADLVTLTVPVIFITDTISTMEQLLALQPTGYGKSVYGYYVLTDDIGSLDTAVKGYEMQVDAESNNGFRGAIDGRGYTISLTVANVSNQFGLFAKMKGATIRNVTFDCADMYTLWGTALLARTIDSTKFENVTFNFRKVTVTDSYAYGLLAEYGLLNSTFNNVHFIVNANQSLSLLGARVLGFEGNMFTDCKVSLMNGSTLSQIGHTTNGTSEDQNDDTVYIEYDGITVVNVEERVTTLSYTQDLVLSEETVALNLGAYKTYTISSITYGAYDLGNDINALVIPDELRTDFQNHGEGKTIVVKASKYAEVLSINVPVTIVTGAIKEAGHFKALQLTKDNEQQSIYGYYILANDITSASAIVAGGRDGNDASKNGQWGFRGTLDGRGYTVTTPAGSRGLFGSMGSGAVIKDITLSYTSVDSTQWATDLLGTSVIGVTFKNVTFDVKNIKTSTDRGLIGERNVRDCDFINVIFNLYNSVDTLFAWPKANNWVGFNTEQQNYPNTLCTFSNCRINLLDGATLNQLGKGYNGSTMITYQPMGATTGENVVNVNGITLNDNTTDTYLLRNNASPYTIVVPASMTTEMSYAKTELIKFFKEATGVELQAIIDNGMTHTDSGMYISLGNTKLAAAAGLSVPTLKRDGAYVTTYDKTIYILGGSDAGVLNGVYALLGELFGYEQYYKDCYDLKTGVKEIELKNFDITDNPDIDYRGSGGTFYTTNMDTVTEDDKMYSYRLGSTDAYWKHIMPVSNAADNSKEATDHNSLYYFPIAMYKTSNPEFYSNNSTFDGNSWGGINAQLCYTARGNSAGTYDLMTTLAAERIQAALIKHVNNKQYTAVQLGIEDCYQMCTCSGCQAIIDQYGAISATVIIFLNDVAVKVNAWMESNPTYARDLQYMFFAYHETQKAPTTYPTVSKGVKMAPFVGISNMDHSKAITDTTTRSTTALGTISNNTLYGWMRSWGEFANSTGGKPWVWSYGAFIYDYFVFYDSYEFYKGFYKAIADFGYEMSIVQQHSSQRGADTAFFAMNAYVNNALAWDSSLDIDTLIDNYMKAMYKDAAEEMKNLYNKWRELYASKLSGLTNSDSDPASKLNVKKGWLWDTAITDDTDALFAILDEAYAAIAHYETSNPELYAKLKAHIDMEWLAPAKIALTGKAASKYKQNGKYDEMAAKFRTLCNDFGIVALSEFESIDKTLNNL